MDLEHTGLSFGEGGEPGSRGAGGRRRRWAQAQVGRSDRPPEMSGGFVQFRVMHQRGPATRGHPQAASEAAGLRRGTGRRRRAGPWPSPPGPDAAPPPCWPSLPRCRLLTPPRPRTPTPGTSRRGRVPRFTELWFLGSGGCSGSCVLTPSTLQTHGARDRSRGAGPAGATRSLRPSPGPAPGGQGVVPLSPPVRGTPRSPPQRPAVRRVPNG